MVEILPKKLDLACVSLRASTFNVRLSNAHEETNGERVMEMTCKKGLFNYSKINS